MIVPVIMAGGAGTRLWPASRQLFPKPFLNLVNGESLLNQTYQRVLQLDGVKNILTITNRELFFHCRDQIEQLGDALVEDFHFVLEPEPKNTTAAIAAACNWVSEHYGDETVMLIFAADHLINDIARFSEAVKTASVEAEKGGVITFGISPTRAETGYGYIEATSSDPVSSIGQFIEKPDAKKAAALLENPNVLWNSGMFAFTAGTMLEQMGEHVPDTVDAVAKSYSEAKKETIGGLSAVHLGPSFADAEDISIDYAVMEPTNRGVIVRGEFDWSDIGSWNEVAKQFKTDGDGNAADGDVIYEGARDCFVRSHNRVTAMVGTQNLVVVDTSDAILIADRDKTQAVKDVVSILKNRGGDTHMLHTTAYRPWGSYTVLQEAPGFKIKRIEVRPGAALSLQKHYHRSEHWIIVSGAAEVVNGDEEFILRPNESIYIKAGNIHRLSNPGKVQLIMIEVQCGEYLGEDDIVRLEDVYGRS